MFRFIVKKQRLVFNVDMHINLLGSLLDVTKKTFVSQNNILYFAPNKNTSEFKRIYLVDTRNVRGNFAAYNANQW